MKVRQQVVIKTMDSTGVRYRVTVSEAEAIELRDWLNRVYPPLAEDVRKEQGSQ